MKTMLRTRGKMSGGDIYHIMQHDMFNEHLATCPWTWRERERERERIIRAEALKRLEWQAV